MISSPAHSPAHLTRPHHVAHDCGRLLRQIPPALAGAPAHRLRPQDGAIPYADEIEASHALSASRLFAQLEQEVGVHPIAAVLSDGTLVASFHAIDVRGTFLSSPRLWVVRSTDGGRTFLPNVRVASAHACNDTPANRATIEDGRTTIVRRWGDGGDYHGLVALPDGSFRAVWADSRTGVYQLWTPRIVVAR